MSFKLQAKFKDFTKHIEPAFSQGMATSWHSINWRNCEIRVRKLQVRIAKATKEKEFRQVKKLQRMLVRSFSAKALAVKRVTENRGKKTCGVDGETWDNPKDKYEAIFRLNKVKYKPKPLRRVYIPKSDGNKRPLGIPTMLDRAMQALYLLALEPVSETLADRNSYGFRPMRSTHDAIEQCFVALSRKTSSEWILEGDIKGCFDNISHDWLLKYVPIDKVILKRWLKAGYLEKNKLHQTNTGTPQGGIISPVLANLALDGLEEVLESHFGKKNTKASYKTKVNFVRYADDFIITGISRELLEDKVKPLVIDFLKQRGLTLSETKTKITHIDDGFDFLGQNIRKYNGKLLIKPSRKSVHNVLTKIKLITKTFKTQKQEWLIDRLNPILRGWGNYHKSVVAKETFKYIDYRVWKLLWKWSTRRHGNRQKRWVKSKYFNSLGSRKWMFNCVTEDKKLKKLVYLSDIPIKRHTKLKAEFNPYLPEYDSYLETRLEKDWKVSINGKSKLLILWLKQDKRCVCCNQLVTKQTGWNIHHILERHKGGKDNLDNLVVLHPNCHRKLHN